MLRGHESSLQTYHDLSMTGRTSEATMRRPNIMMHGKVGLKQVISLRRE